jgi:L-threonylcarbamoyladenylate synthase
METKLIKIDNVKGQRDALHAAGELIRSGEVVAFPTETVYGLGANGLDADACAKIYQAKGRPSDNPLILHVANRSMIDQVAAAIPDKAEKLLAAFCPGPITLILPRRSLVPDRITGGLSTVGVRMPEHDVARALIAAAGVPIAAPSANISGRPSPTTAEAVLTDMDGKIPLILDGGSCDFGVESTIVDAVGDKAVILRPGAITKEMLEEVLGAGNVIIDPALVGKDSVPRAPGMKYTHYSPKATVRLIEGDDKEFRAKVIKLGLEAREKNVKVAILDYDNDPGKAAHKLFADLRELDRQGYELVLIRTLEERGFGFSVMNRMLKSAGYDVVK